MPWESMGASSLPTRRETTVVERVVPHYINRVLDVDVVWSAFANQWLVIALCTTPLADALTSSQRGEKPAAAELADVNLAPHMAPGHSLAVPF